MQVQAMMRVTGRAERNWSVGEKVDAVEVTLQPVYSADHASPNYSWSQATPSGEVKLTITNPAAYEQFKIGGSYLVTFERVEG